MKYAIILLAACLLFMYSFRAFAEPPATRDSEYLDFNHGEKIGNDQWIQSIVIKSPELRSDVKGDVQIQFQAKDMNLAQAFCWQQPTAANHDPIGHDAQLTPLMKLDPEGNGSFIFHADSFPNGPITVRILAANDAKKRDIRELQLYNTGGIKWNQGVPKADPPGAAGLKLAFYDDFDLPLSISKTGAGARYTSHKPGGGDFSGWPFSDIEGDHNPFSQRDTYLRIHASKAAGTKGSSGLISPLKLDGTGFSTLAPCYFECRFIAQSAPGTWPAFWTLTKGDWTKKKGLCDELDVIEAYGGMGKSNPNSPGVYAATTHFWNLLGPDGKKMKMPYPTHKNIPMLELGGKSSWSTTFHTYGVRVTKTDTVYYYDNVEVLRHPSGDASKTLPHFFLINYAIGGISGWHIDLEREHNASDMYLDFVRVYDSGDHPIKN